MHSINVCLENLNEQYKLQYVAKQACGSVFYQSGGCVMLACVALEHKSNEEDFLPLSVQYIQKSYAMRKIPGGFMKREGKPSEFEILTSRIIDRTLRPLFPKGFCYPTQITVYLLSYDGTADVQVCALHAAANALLLSSLSFVPPVSSVRIGRINNNFIVNPTTDQLAQSSLDLYVSGSNEDLLMIEMKGSDKDLNEAMLLEAINLARGVISKDCEQFSTLLLPLKNEIIPFALQPIEPQHEIYELIQANYDKSVKSALLSMSKSERSVELDIIAEDISASFPQYERVAINETLNLYKKHCVRKMILEDNVRADGRGLEDIRPISIETNILPFAHSSALFTRGQTQALVTCTLGAESDAKIQEGLQGNVKEKFMFHYNFPGFSVGEASMIGSPSRRELGHGNLAKRALESSFKGNDWTIRLVSEILESNGSSSMASVCGGSLALRACGLESELIAGVAMGLVVEEDKYAILSDIMGLEDHDGDMDFKIAGARDYISAMQMDIKLGGLDIEILKEAMEQARRARIKILDIMDKASKEININWELLPRNEAFLIPPQKIVEVIGQGGKTIKEIIEKFGVSIDLNRDNGEVRINSQTQSALNEAKSFILSLVYPQEKYHTGQIIEGEIKKVVDFGVFVGLPSGGDGLVHISKIPKSSQPLNAFFKEGAMLKTQVIGMFKGKIELALA